MGLVSILNVPMSIRDRVVGVGNTYTSEPHEFTETEQNIFPKKSEFDNLITCPL
jgi:hypothetical protein